MSHHSQSLQGVVVALTRMEEAGSSVADDIRSRGGVPVHVPCVKISCAERGTELDELWEHIDAFDRVLVGSPSALKVFARYPVPRTRVPVTSVGEATAHHISSDPHLNQRFVVQEVATQRRSEGMLKVLHERFGSLKGKRFLLPRPPEGRSWLMEALRAEGADSRAVETYRIHCARPATPPMEWSRIDVFTFLSGRTLSCFLEVMADRGRELLKQRVVAVIGPVAKRQAEALGVPVQVMPDRASAKDLVGAVAKYVADTGTTLAVTRPT